MSVRLVVQKQGEGLLIVRIPFRARILPALLVIWLLPATAGFGMTPTGLLGAVFTVTCALAAIYEYSWLFDVEAGSVERRMGLLFLYHRKRFAFSDIKRVVCTGALYSSHQPDGHSAGTKKRAGIGSHVTLALEDRTGRRIPLEHAGGIRSAQLEITGREIASFCDLEYGDLTL